MREAAWGGGLFLIAERPGVRGMGCRSTCPYDTAAPLKRKSALSDYPRPICRASLTHCRYRSDSRRRMRHRAFDLSVALNASRFRSPTPSNPSNELSTDRNLSAA